MRVSQWRHEWRHAFWSSDSCRRHAGGSLGGYVLHRHDVASLAKNVVAVAAVAAVTVVAAAVIKVWQNDDDSPQFNYGTAVDAAVDAVPAAITIACNEPIAVSATAVDPPDSNVTR